MNILTYNSGLIKCINDTPMECIAINSDCSANFPVSIIDANSTARGNAIGINVSIEYHNNSMIIFISNPLPIRSSIYFHRNCINRTATTIDRVRRNGRIKDETINCFKILKVVLLKSYEPRCFINAWT